MDLLHQNIYLQGLHRLCWVWVPYTHAIQVQLRPAHVWAHPASCCTQGVQVYFIDLFDSDAATVAAMNAAGLVPVCYFSTQYENWRPDAAQFPAAALGNALGEGKHSMAQRDRGSTQPYRALCTTADAS